MITGAHIRNYRCLENVELTFEPLTILVGANASGKTALLNALEPGGPLDKSQGWRRQEVPTVSISVDGGRHVRRDEVTYRMQTLHLDLDALRSLNQLEEAPFLVPTGLNLANVFATLTRSEQAIVVERLTALLPMYADITARPATNGRHRLMFQDRWNPTLWYEPAQVSDGSILLLAFLVMQLQREKVDLVAIEEPERGLHPYLLGQLVDMLRQMANGRLAGRRAQVIVATHSAELLAYAEPHEVRFLSRRREDGATQVERAPTDSTDWTKAVAEYEGSLGSMWLSGALGGVPGG